MKLRQNKGFPYPVLSQYTDDYNGVNFDSYITGGINGFDYVIKFNATLTDDGINTLIKEKKAELVYHIECSQTGYRNVYKAKSFIDEIKIPLKKLRGNVEVNSFIVACEYIDQYVNPNLDEDYKDKEIIIKSGFILAEGIQTDLPIPRKYTDFIENNNPFVAIVPMDNKESNTMSINIYKEKITVIVPKKIATNYNVAQQSYKKRFVLYCMFLVPAIYRGLLFFKSASENELNTMSDRLWVQSLEELLKTRFKISLDDIKEKDESDLYDLAQEIMDCPLEDASDYLIQRGGESY